MDWKEHFNRDENGYIVLNGNNIDYAPIYKPINYYLIWLKTTPRVLFKENKLGTDLMGEIVAAEIAKVMGVDCVNVYPAKFEGLPRKFNRNSIGVMVEDYVKDKQTESIIMYYILGRNDIMLNSVDKHILGIKKFIEDAKNENKIIRASLSAIKLELLKRNILDFVLLQEDRKPCNIEYLITKDKDGNGILTLAPMFDNGRCLFFQDKSMMKKLIARKSNPQVLKHTLKKETEAFPFCFFPEATNSYFETYDFSRYKLLLAQKIEQNLELKKFFNELEYIEPNQIIERIEQKNPGFKFSKIHAQVFEMIFTHQIRTLHDCVLEIELKNQNFQTNIAQNGGAEMA